VHTIVPVRNALRTATRLPTNLRRALAGSAVRQRAARRRLGAWTVLAVVGVGVHHEFRPADATRRAWGSSTPVVVVTAPVPAGTRLRSPAVVVRPMPLGIVPEGALQQLPTSGRATIDLAPGQVLTAAMVDRSRRGPVAGALPAGTVGVVVGTGPLRPAVSPGDHVDVVATDTTARRATVVQVSDDAVTLAVRPAEAAAVGSAALVGPVALILLR
jgi:Flp pilus assembly protein CpaB